MSNDTHKSPFQVSELVAMIADYLFPRDITNLMVTCKALYQRVNPSFWKTVTIKARSPRQELVFQNRLHIRSLHVCAPYDHILDVLAADQPPVLLYKLLTSFPKVNTSVSTSSGISNLRKMTISYNHYDLSSALKLISSSPCLVSLHFPPTVLQRHIELFLYMISNRLPQLKEISVGENYSQPIEYEVTIRFLLLCFEHPQLESLAFAFSTDFRDYTEGSLNALLPPESRAENGSRSKITTIKLDSWGTYPVSFIIRLILNRCHYLKRFEAPRIALDVDNQNVDNLDVNTARISCVNLEHVKIPIYDWPFEFTDFLFEECGQCTRLKTINISSPNRFCSEDIDVTNFFFETPLGDAGGNRGNRVLLSSNRVHP